MRSIIVEFEILSGSIYSKIILGLFFHCSNFNIRPSLYHSEPVKNAKKNYLLFLFNLILPSTPSSPHVHSINGCNVMGAFVSELVKA